MILCVCDDVQQFGEQPVGKTNIPIKLFVRFAHLSHRQGILNKADNLPVLFRLARVEVAGQLFATEM